MARKRTATNLHQLSVKAVQNAGDGDLSDGGRLILRVRGDSASWVDRYTAATGKRREMGLGVARRGSAAQAHKWTFVTGLALMLVARDWAPAVGALRAPVATTPAASTSTAAKSPTTAASPVSRAPSR